MSTVIPSSSESDTVTAAARPVSPNIQHQDTNKQHQVKINEVCNEVIMRLQESNNPVVNTPGFCESIQSHFHRFPVRYAADMNVERVEDVLMHKELLELARTKGSQPVYHVRAVHVLPLGPDIADPATNPSVNQENLHPPPSFGRAANLEALALELASGAANQDTSNGGPSMSKFRHAPMHEVTFSTLDKPKILSKLSSTLADVGLNIREAHVFSTHDQYSLDVFLVDGWPTEDVEDLKRHLDMSIEKICSETSPVSSPSKASLEDKPTDMEVLKVKSDCSDDWEIDYNLLRFEKKIASGSFGDLYRGTYCGQDVAIKILKPERLNEDLEKEFAQEVGIMRKVRHKNVVQFIGACTRPPNLCIVTEFMSKGSIYDYLHKEKGVFRLPVLLKVAIDVSKGMDYLHQCKIIHRDLKAANLLMDEHEVIKVADFGVARVQAQGGVMTAETGTYRWMAPEVIGHKPYDHKADIFSFGVVVWELLTGKLPYDHLTPLQAAVGVVQMNLRPEIPKHIPPALAALLKKCWEQNPAHRPEFSEITKILNDILREVQDEERRDKKGIFSGLKRTSQ